MGSVRLTWQTGQADAGGRLWAVNQGENPPIRERAILQFGQMKSLQKFTSVHDNPQSYCNLERRIVNAERA